MVMTDSKNIFANFFGNIFKKTCKHNVYKVLITEELSTSQKQAIVKLTEIWYLGCSLFLVL